MKRFIVVFIFTSILISCQSEPIKDPVEKKEIVDESSYLDSIKMELCKEWPNNRTINLVFHGHSVPSGYYNTPFVNTFGSYPYLLLKQLKEEYPNAVINVITTSIGGENSINGAKRFDSEVLVHRPDVLFIDYSLNDRGAGLENAYAAWDEMILKALDQDIKVILLSPSPDRSKDLFDNQIQLYKHRVQVIELAEKYDIALVDSYGLFRKAVNGGEKIEDLMAHIYHPNEKGHQLIADGIFEYFK